MTTDQTTIDQPPALNGSGNGHAHGPYPLTPPGDPDVPPDAALSSIELFEERARAAGKTPILCNGEAGRVFQEMATVLASHEDVFVTDAGWMYIDRNNAKYPGEVRLVELKASHAWGIMAKRAECYRLEGPTERPVACHPSLEIIKSILVSLNELQPDNLRPLVDLVGAPFLTESFEVVDTPGYDPASKLLVTFEAGVFERVEESPDRDDVAAAVESLLELLHEFPFKTPAMQAAYLAALASPGVRHALPRANVPFFLVTANQKNSGKTTLCDIAGWIWTGRKFPPIQSVKKRDKGETNDELRKQLTSHLIQKRTAVVIENVESGTDIQASILDSAGTMQADYEDRILNTNRMANGRLPFIYITGNNIRAVADTDRRVLPVELDLRCRYDARRFERNIEKHVRENRARYVHDLLTILRGYVVAGRPLRGARAFDSYQEWVELVADAIGWAFGVHPLDARTEFAQSADEEQSALGRLIRAMQALDPHGNGLRAEMIVAAGKADANIMEAILDYCEVDHVDKLRTKGFTGKLKRDKGVVVNGVRVNHRQGAHGFKLWYVEEVSPLEEAVDSDA